MSIQRERARRRRRGMKQVTLAQLRLEEIKNMLGSKELLKSWGDIDATDVPGLRGKRAPPKDLSTGHTVLRDKPAVPSYDPSPCLLGLLGSRAPAHGL